MSSVNKVMLMGNLTRSPEVKTLPSGNSVCEFGLAINRKFTTRDGDERDEVAYVELSCFGRGGEVIKQYCDKGSPLFVEGRLRYDSWQNDKGEKRNRLSVIVDNFQLLPDGRGRGGSDSGSGSGGDGLPPIPEPF
jgi:single-strand DNA-binding protein